MVVSGHGVREWTEWRDSIVKCWWFNLDAGDYTGRLSHRAQAKAGNCLKDCQSDGSGYEQGPLHKSKLWTLEKHMHWVTGPYFIILKMKALNLSIFYYIGLNQKVSVHYMVRHLRTHGHYMLMCCFLTISRDSVLLCCYNILHFSGKVFH